MGVVTLLLRRLRTHPTAFVAVATSVLMSMTVVATLQTLSVAIGDAGVRGGLDVPPAQRSVVVTAGLRPGELAAADRRVRAALDPGVRADLTRTTTATTLGIRGRATTDRALLLDAGDLRARAALVTGAWPRTPQVSAGAVRGEVEVVLTEAGARALAVPVGTRLVLRDLVSADTPPLVVHVVGVVRPTRVADGVWDDDPLGLAGEVRSDFTTFGPLVTADGALDLPVVSSTAVSWRWTPRVGAVGAGGVVGLRSAVDATVDRLSRLVSGESGRASTGTDGPLRDAAVTSGLPDLLERAEQVGARVRVSLLTPTVLLVVLGTASLVVAAALLAGLRDTETRLMRARGASPERLAGLALADALAVVLLGAVGAVLLAPVLARLLTRAAGVPEPPAGLLPPGVALLAVALMGVLAVVVIVGTTLRVGRSRADTAARGGAGRVLRVLAGSGLDVALVALSVLGVVQLRRYDAASAVTVDPLTTVAPALVVAGVSVLCLRLLPLLTRGVSRLTSGRPGLDVAWAGWQLSRRLAGQAGTVLLVLLALAMGTLALAHSATAERAVADQSAFDTGAPARVLTGGLTGADLAGALTSLEVVSGGAARVVPVARDRVDLGPVADVTVLALDARTASGVLDPRPDTLGGRSWRSVAGVLAAARPTLDGLALPVGARTLAVTAAIDDPFGTGDFTQPGWVLLTDARGLLVRLPAGDVGTRPTTLSVTLPRTDGAWRLLGAGVAVDPNLVAVDGSAPFRFTLSAATADGQGLAGLDRLSAQSGSGSVAAAVRGSTLDALPALVTREVASGAGVTVGDRLDATVAGRRVTLRVAALADSVPTASVPARAVVVDLASVLAAPVGGTGDRLLGTDPLTPGEWWLDPVSPVTTERLLAGLPGTSTAELRSDLVAERTGNPVNAGMRGAMLLVTAAALVLAAVGFAATTAALGRERRRENAVLLALGMPPRRIRRVLEAERLLVVVLTTLVGLGLGVLAALAVVPLLVGGDGHRQVPPVVVTMPWGALLAFAAVVAGALSLVGVLVLRGAGRDVAAELRRGVAE